MSYSQKSGQWLWNPINIESENVHFASKLKIEAYNRGIFKVIRIEKLQFWKETQKAGY